MNPIRLLTLLLISCLLPNLTESVQIQAQTLELPSMSLEDAGLNRDSINLLLSDIQTTPHRDFRGLVVIKDNHIVLEEYYNTFWRNTIHDIRSAGKSVTAMLLGIAMKEGLIKSLDQDVYSFFPKEKYPEINEAYKTIQLKHLLSMSSGLDADSDRPETPGQAGQWMGLSDWTPYLLSVPANAAPGENWIYADINTVLIGAIIEEQSGMSLRDYAQQKLFGPLGFEQVYWYTTTANQTGAAGNLYITTLDFAKLGIVIANEGIWNGKQLLEPAYVKLLVDSDDFNISDYFSMVDGYGMFWYKTSRTFGDNTVDYVSALGNGGNQLIVIPAHEMVIALTSSAYGPTYGHGRSYTIMSRILAALE